MYKSLILRILRLTGMLIDTALYAFGFIITVTSKNCVHGAVIDDQGVL
jgi:hypothetical protein